LPVDQFEYDPAFLVIVRGADLAAHLIEESIDYWAGGDRLGRATLSEIAIRGQEIHKKVTSESVDSHQVAIEIKERAPGIATCGQAVEAIRLVGPRDNAAEPKRCRPVAAVAQGVT
jgi:hypothetical protein